MINTPDLSIIIINYKTPELILDCLSSIYAYTTSISFEIIIVNNASKANDEALIKSKFSEIRWLEMGYNAGFGRANNAGMKAANGRYVLLLNSDTLLINDVLPKAIQRLENEPQTIAVSAVQLDKNKSVKPIIHSYAHLLRYSWILLPLKSSDNLLAKLIPEKKYADPEEVDYLPGAFMLMKKEAFEKTGGFDENIFMYAEDSEWSNRLAQNGKIKLLADCQFVHDEWGSSPELKSKQSGFTYFNRFDQQAQLSNLYFIRKYKGGFYFLVLMCHYWAWVPLFYIIKFVSRLKDFKNPFSDYAAQHTFASTIRVFSSYWLDILFKRKKFLKIETK